MDRKTISMKDMENLMEVTRKAFNNVRYNHNKQVIIIEDDFMISVISYSRYRVKQYAGGPLYTTKKRKELSKILGKDVYGTCITESEFKKRNLI